MDQKERSADHTAAMSEAFAGWQRGIWTAMPGIVQSYSPSDNTVSIQPAIRAVILKQDPASGKQAPAAVNLPLLIKVPVVFMGGGGYVATFPISQGDEALVVFSSRSIDAWWQSGGVQNQIEQRAHDLSDGIAIVGLYSVPRVPGSISTDSAQIRSLDGTTRVRIGAGGIDMHSSGTITFSGSNCSLDGSGNLNMAGAIIAGYGGGDQVSLQTHKHGTGSPASGTSVPTPGT